MSDDSKKVLFGQTVVNLPNYGIASIPFHEWVKTPFYFGHPGYNIQTPSPQEFAEHITKPLNDRIEILEKKLAELTDIVEDLIQVNKEVVDGVEKENKNLKTEIASLKEQLGE